MTPSTTHTEEEGERKGDLEILGDSIIKA